MRGAILHSHFSIRLNGVAPKHGLRMVKRGRVQACCNVQGSDLSRSTSNHPGTVQNGVLGWLGSRIYTVQMVVCHMKPTEHNIGMRRITTFRSTTDRIYDGGHTTI